MGLNRAGGGRIDAADELEQGALARAVVADDAEPLAGLDVEINPADGMDELGGAGVPAAEDEVEGRFLDAPPGLIVHAKGELSLLEPDEWLHGDSIVGRVVGADPAENRSGWGWLGSEKRLDMLADLVGVLFDRYAVKQERIGDLAGRLGDKGIGKQVGRAAEDGVTVVTKANDGEPQWPEGICGSSVDGVQEGFGVGGGFALSPRAQDKEDGSCVQDGVEGGQVGGLDIDRLERGIAESLGGGLSDELAVAGHGRVNDEHLGWLLLGGEC